MKPSTPLIVMNWQERARRAEELAERLATASASLVAGHTSPDAFRRMRLALDAWHQHRADLSSCERSEADGQDGA